MSFDARQPFRTLYTVRCIDTGKTPVTNAPHETALLAQLALNGVVAKDARKIADAAAADALFMRDDEQRSECRITGSDGMCYQVLLNRYNTTATADPARCDQSNYAAERAASRSK